MAHRFERNIDPRIGKVNVCLFCSESFRHPNHTIESVNAVAVANGFKPLSKEESDAAFDRGTR